VLTTRNSGDAHGEVSLLTDAELDDPVAYLREIE